LVIKKKIKRFNLVLLFILGGGLSLFFLLKALEEEIVFFYTPSEAVKRDFNVKGTIRVGGIVVRDSIKYKDNMDTSFTLTDKKKELDINYYGILPDLFREGQGVIAEGSMDKKNNIFRATKVLAKHDENYMPPEVYKSINEDK
tara:strand:+ start:1516 stop:1944 length:429 start_codon:yes stop_codon:yes gene_type:complete